MIHLIPTVPDRSWYSLDVTLDGVAYRLTLAWCERERRWYLDLETSDGTRVATGRKIVADSPLLEREVDDLAPPGILIALDGSAEGIDPDLRDLGSRVLLLYIDEADRA